MPFDIFISYSSKDRAIAKQLAAHLEKRWIVWWDHNLVSGDDFARSITTAINKTTITLVLVSANSITSAWVAKEVQLAIKTGRLIPIRLDNTPLPDHLKHLHAITLRNWDLSETPEIAQLQRDIALRRELDANKTIFRYLSFIWVPLLKLKAGIVSVVRTLLSLTVWAVYLAWNGIKIVAIAVAVPIIIVVGLMTWYGLFSYVYSFYDPKFGYGPAEKALEVLFPSNVLAEKWDPWSYTKDEKKHLPVTKEEPAIAAVRLATAKTWLTMLESEYDVPLDLLFKPMQREGIYACQRRKFFGWHKEGMVDIKLLFPLNGCPDPLLVDTVYSSWIESTQALRTGQADFPHPALGQNFTPSPTAKPNARNRHVRFDELLRSICVAPNVYSTAEEAINEPLIQVLAQRNCLAGRLHQAGLVSDEDVPFALPGSSAGAKWRANVVAAGRDNESVVLNRLSPSHDEVERLGHAVAILKGVGIQELEKEAAAAAERKAVEVLKSLQHTNLHAKFNLGMAYTFGRGAPVNVELGLQLIDDALARGLSITDSMDLVKKGCCIVNTIDFVETFKRLNVASMRGDVGAKALKLIFLQRDISVPPCESRCVTEITQLETEIRASGMVHYLQILDYGGAQHARLRLPQGGTSEVPPDVKVFLKPTKLTELSSKSTVAIGRSGEFATIVRKLFSIGRLIGKLIRI